MKLFKKKQKTFDISFNDLKMFLLPATRSQTGRVYSIHSGGRWSSRRRALSWCFCANTSASGSSGTRPSSTSLQTSLQQGLLGRERHPTIPQDTAGRLRREIRGKLCHQTWGKIESSGCFLQLILIPSKLPKWCSTASRAIFICVF